MKTLTVVLAAAAVSAVAIWTVVDTAGWLGSMGGGVLMDDGAFVFAIGGTAVLSGALTLLLMRLVRREEHRRLDALQDRIDRLESERRG